MGTGVKQSPLQVQGTAALFVVEPNETSPVDQLWPKACQFATSGVSKGESKLVPFSVLFQ